MSMKSRFDFLLRSWAEWFFRRQRLGLALITSGIFLCGLLLSPWFEVYIPIGESGISIGFTGEGPISIGSTLPGLGFIVGILMIVLGIWISYVDWGDGRRRTVIAIECRGLRDNPGQPLDKCLPRRISGSRQLLILDLRQGICDGRIVDPDAALTKIQALPNNLATRTEGLDRSDFKVVVGALAPVPLVFWLGCILDDEDDIEVFDWDRHAGHWRPLDEFDDGQRFEVTWSDKDLRNCKEAVLAVSASYSIDMKAATALIQDRPCITMNLAGRSTDSHWSREKQVELGRQFMETVMRLGTYGVETIHLFLASPASLTLRLGMLYDLRNLPRIRVYQFDQRHQVHYPWYLETPGSQGESAKIGLSSSQDFEVQDA